MYKRNNPRRRPVVLCERNAWLIRLERGLRWMNTQMFDIDSSINFRNGGSH